MAICGICCIFAVCSLNTFAYSSGSDISDTFTFLSIVMIVAGILEIILFFKIWIMTNHVALLKKKIVDFSYGSDLDKTCRRLLIMGRREEVRDIMIDQFVDELEKRLEMTRGQEFMLEKLKAESIAKYVNQLEQNLNSIGEPVPENIQKLATFGDYMKLTVGRVDSK